MVRQADDEMTAHISPAAFAIILVTGILIGAAIVAAWSSKRGGEVQPADTDSDWRQEP